MEGPRPVEYPSSSTNKKPLNTSPPKSFIVKNMHKIIKYNNGNSMLGKGKGEEEEEAAMETQKTSLQFSFVDKKNSATQRDSLQNKNI